MKGFVVGLIIIALVLVTVIGSTAFAEAKLSMIYEVIEESGDYGAARDILDGAYPLLFAISPSELLRDATDKLTVCESGGGEVEKSRLLLAIDELRRQIGACPVSFL